LYAFVVLGSQQVALKAKSKTITRMKDEINKLVVEKQMMDEELAFETIC